MTDRGHDDNGLDRDLNIKGIVAVGIALALATALGALLSWWLAVGLRDRIEGQDPPPPTLIEAMRPYEPPTPNLQTDPAAALGDLRAEESAILEHYEWDGSRRAARVPIDRAMELLLETRPGAEAFGGPDASNGGPGDLDTGGGLASPEAGGETP